MKKVLFIISLLALAACDFPHSGGVGPPRPDRDAEGDLPAPKEQSFFNNLGLSSTGEVAKMLQQ